MAILSTRYNIHRYSLLPFSPNPMASSDNQGLGMFAMRGYFAGGRCLSQARLDGKTVIITGSNTGIGKETAADLAGRGAKVILACRDVNKAELAAESIRKTSGNTQVIAHKLNLASLNSIREFAQKIKDTEPQVNILINNAGVMACPKWETEDGFELQFGTNHLGHFLLTHELLDILKSSTPSRVINLSSIAHASGTMHWDDLQLKNDYEPFTAYRQSKLANVLFTRELHRRLSGTGVTTYSVHPGVIRTQLWQHAPTWWRSLICYALSFFLKSVEEGSQTSIHCAVAEDIEKDSGKYFADCAVKKASPEGENDEYARRLWEVSEQLLGMKPKDEVNK